MTKLHDLIGRCAKEEAIELITKGDRVANAKAFFKRYKNYYTHGHFDGSGITALQLATNQGFDNVVIAMLQNHADPNGKDSDGAPPLHALAMINHGNRHPYNDDLKHGSQFKTRYTRCIDNILRAYVVHGADVNLSDNIKRTPLHYACGDLMGAYVDYKKHIWVPSGLFDGRNGEGHIGVVRG
jgi:ankyrin repeat protein